MRVSISNCNQFMEWDAAVGDETKRFSYRGKAYGEESTAASNQALGWIQGFCDAKRA
jgi:hypothetical protein